MTINLFAHRKLRQEGHVRKTVWNSKTNTGSFCQKKRESKNNMILPPLGSYLRAANTPIDGLTPTGMQAGPQNESTSRWGE